MTRTRRHNNLAVLLDERGMSYGDLATVIGASTVHVSKVAQGTAPCSDRFKHACALALDVRIADIWPIAAAVSPVG